jgi:hypothetical protein
LLCPKPNNSSFLVYVAMQKGCSLLAFRRNFIALVLIVHVTRPVVVTAGVYDEQRKYLLLVFAMRRGARSLHFDVISQKPNNSSFLVYIAMQRGARSLYFDVIS